MRERSYYGQAPIETASATTSSENSKSGPVAYIIFGVTFGVLLLLSLVASGCTAYIVEQGLEYSYAGGESAPSYLYDDYYMDDYYDYDDLDGFDRDLERELERLFGEGGGRPQVDLT